MLFGATLVIVTPGASADTCMAAYDPYLLCMDYYSSLCQQAYLNVVGNVDPETYAGCMLTVILNAITGGPPQ
jgi:hypothetical protein